MIHHEKGVIGNSTMTYFIPSTNALEHLFFHNYTGVFFTTTDYCIRREAANIDAPFLMILVRKGSLHLEFDGKHFVAHGGELLLFNCHQPHCYYSECATQFQYVHFGGSESFFLADRICQGGQHLFSLSNLKEVRSCFNTLITYTEESIPNEYLISSRIYQLLILILTGKGSAQTNDLNHQRIASAIEQMKQHLDRELSIQELSDRLGLNPSYFIRIFKQYTDLSPYEYLINLRITHAKMLLNTTTQSVSSIAARCGYEDSSYFIRLFKKYTGSTPLQFKKYHL